MCRTFARFEYTRILLILIFILSAFAQTFGQSNRTATVKGTITDEHDYPLSNVTIKLLNSLKRVQSDKLGTFELADLARGSHSLTFTLAGYDTVVRNVNLQEAQSLHLNIRLTAVTHMLQEVKITGVSETIKTRKQPYNVSAIDAKKLHNTTYDLNQALNKVSGVRVRESGGLGSSFNFSLNGFTGSQVKFFLDGMPMDNFGTSLQMNNIPINIADQIEVYKGVAPVKLGADALGGAINIITSTSKRNYLDVSYAYGSFNTHKSSINAGYTSNSGFTFQLSAFQNYSDNNYKVDVEVADLATGLYVPKTVRRFHDRYRNETVIFNAGVVGKKYADKLLLGITVGQNDAQIQTGNRMFDVYGGRSRNGKVIMPSIKYLKNNLFVKGLNLTLHANRNFGYEQTVDTLNRQYNWLGEYRDKSNDPLAAGGELSRTLYKFKNNSSTISSKLDYAVNQTHLFTLNNTFTTFNRKGNDQLNPDNELNRQPRKNYKNVIGSAYQFSSGNSFNLTLFYKNYNQSTVSFNQYRDQNLPIGTPDEYHKVKKHLNHSGYGGALTFFPQKSIQVKTSFERAYRLPDNDEIFGNRTIDLLDNFSLNPERSDNINMGISFVQKAEKNHRFGAESNLIYRNAKDFIRPSLVSNGSIVMAKMLNQQDVRITGIDGTFNYMYKDFIISSVNVTYQNIRNNTKYEPGASEISDVYKDRVPNMPYLFGNVDVQYLIKDVVKKGAQLNIGYHLTYVHEYFLNWPSRGQAGTKPIIPEQVQQDINILYTLHDGRYNIGFECRNILDAKIYDNYSLQKPGRFFSLKFRYFISGKHLK